MIQTDTGSDGPHYQDGEEETLKITVVGLGCVGMVAAAGDWRRGATTCWEWIDGLEFLSPEVECIRPVQQRPDEDQECQPQQGECPARAPDKLA